MLSIRMRLHSATRKHSHSYTSQPQFTKDSSSSRFILHQCKFTYGREGKRMEGWSGAETEWKKLGYKL